MASARISHSRASPWQCALVLLLAPDSMERLQRADSTKGTVSPQWVEAHALSHQQQTVFTIMVNLGSEFISTNNYFPVIRVRIQYRMWCAARPLAMFCDLFQAPGHKRVINHRQHWGRYTPASNSLLSSLSLLFQVFSLTLNIFIFQPSMLSVVPSCLLTMSSLSLQCLLALVRHVSHTTDSLGLTV